jgi:hypothetical protein
MVRVVRNRKPDKAVFHNVAFGKDVHFDIPALTRMFASNFYSLPHELTPLGYRKRYLFAFESASLTQSVNHLFAVYLYQQLDGQACALRYISLKIRRALFR